MFEAMLAWIVVCILATPVLYLGWWLKKMMDCKLRIAKAAVQAAEGDR